MRFTRGIMETIKEFFDAIKGQLSERLANPFTGAFCIAWAIWNFRLLVVFGGRGTYQEKFAYIDGSLYLDWRYWFLRGLVLPLVSAAAYLWVYPRATRWLAEDYRKQQTKAHNLMKAAEGDTLLSVEASRALRTKYAEAEQAWNNQRDSLSAEIDAQKETTALLAKQNAELRQEIEALKAVEANEEQNHGTHLVFSEPRSSVTRRVPSIGSPENDRFALLQSEAGNLSPTVGKESYSRLQLQMLSLLRDGNRLLAEDFKERLKTDSFDIQRALDRLRAIEVVGRGRESDWFITETGRALLGAFVDTGKWSFTREGF